MATYSWPAIITSIKNKWTTTFVDWPEVEPQVGDSASASASNAMIALSDAVRARIDQRVNIPLPTEVKPGQLQVPLDVDASNLLEVYLEEREEKELKRMSEIQQANQEKRARYLTEHRINLEPIERLQDHANRATIEFALIAIKSSFIMNGGALVVIPAILQFTEKAEILGGRIFLSVGLFVGGIALSSIANFLGYRSMFKAGEGHGSEMNARVIEVSDIYYPPVDPSPNQVEVKRIRDEAQTQFTRARTLERCGIFTFALSVIAFVIGVVIIISALEARPRVPTATPPPAIEFHPLDLS